MELIKEDLRKRAEEIEEFLNLVRFIEGTEIIKNLDNSGGSENELVIGISLKNTLKGEIFLLLYNLIESTMRDSISHIHDELDEREVSFNDLRGKFRKEILKRAKSEKIGLDSLYTKTSSDISKQLLRATFNENGIFSGNIDHKEVCDQARIYGFKHAIRVNSDQILTVKNQRNKLAHGHQSFADIGKLYTIHEIKELTKDVINYLESITDHVSDYIKQQAYLEPTPSFNEER